MSNRPVVLLLSRDTALETVARRALPAEQYTLVWSGQPEDLLRHLLDNFVHAVLIDHALAPGGATESVRQVKEASPDSEVLLLVDRDAPPTAFEGVPCLPRTADPGEIHALVGALLDRQRLAFQHAVLFEASADPILTLDEKGLIQLWNPAAERVFGYSRQEALGQSIQLILPEGFPAFSPEGAGSAASGTTEVEAQKKGGVTIPVFLNFGTSELQGRRVWRAHFRDATVEKQLRTQLLQAEKLSSVGELIAGVAHELNNPLSGVVGYSQLLLARTTDDDLRRDLERISKEADRCRRIVQNLLTFARKHKPERTRVILNDIVDSIIDLRGYELKVGNIDVIRKLDPKLPATLGDFHQLQQVFLNIVNNAQQAMQEAHGRGTITITSARVQETGANEPVLRVTFEDDGPGIPPANLRKIFDPFFTTKPVGKGTGLGLSVCFGIVREHGGRIHARNSNDGKGAAFIVDLPLVDPAGPKAVTMRQSLTPTPVSPPSPLRRDVGRKILVLDDEETVRDLIADVLTMQGHHVQVASSGNVALSMVGREDFDLLVSDLMMPGMTGRMVHEKIRELRPELARRMVFVTGDTLSPETQQFFQEVGAFYISKPFTIEEVEAVIQRALAAS
ncbi:MAG: response regulator [Planctomycetes bacterium]|nr:response regulator [Planctomycetota bacterium]